MKIKFEIVTPEKVVYKKEIKQITVPTLNGEITILPNHVPLVSVIKPGVIEVKNLDDSISIISISGGFIEVNKEKIVILADTAERAEELDENIINEAIKKAENIKQKVDDIDEIKSPINLDTEFARLKALHKWRKLKK